MTKEFKLEREVERFFGDRLKKAGCRTDKFTSPAKRGVPDRIVILPTGEVHFVELKTLQGTLSKLQAHHIKDLKRYGQVALCLWGRADVEKYVSEVTKHIAETRAAQLPEPGERFYQEHPQVRFMDGTRSWKDS